jgi:hypothetical protein
MNRGQLLLGLAMVLLGVLFLAGSIFHVDVWAFCWPVGFILVGIWLVLRPGLSRGNNTPDIVLIGDLRRRGNWIVKDNEIWLGIADVDLDFTGAEIPPGETRYKIYGFVGDVDLVVPAAVGTKVSATGFVIDADLFGRKHQAFLYPVKSTSDDYVTADRKLTIEMVGFVIDIKVKKI